MLRKRILPLMALLISVTSPLFAQAPTALSAEEAMPESSNAYRTYEVQKGDTLWGISKKFIDDPYYWPDLWANNPDVQNPHFILPGEKLRIYAGPITVVGIEAEPPLAPALEGAKEGVAPTAAPLPVKPAVTEPQITLAVPAGLSFISENEQSSSGTVFDFPIARYFAASGDTVFVRVPAETSLRVGDRLQVLKSLGEIIHPVSKKRLGFQVDQLGIIEITALGTDLQTAIVRKNFREIERGAWLAPRRAIREKIALRRAESEMTGMVISTSSHKKLQGPSDALFIDLGESRGLKVGNLLTMTRPRQATDLAPVKNKKDAPIVYPEELIGYALVVETNAETATAVILKSLGPAVVGDLVRTQTGHMTR